MRPVPGRFLNLPARGGVSDPETENLETLPDGESTPGPSWWPPGRRPQGLSVSRSSRRVLRLTLPVIVAGAVLAAALPFWLTRPAPSSPPPVREASAWLPAIDRPAVDRVVPEDAVIDVKRDFGARGDGVTDDTKAIQAAIASGLAPDGKNVVYFPSGTYLVSAPLEWKHADGAWGTGLTLLGQNRDRSVIKLLAAAEGFSDPRQPRAVVVTASKNPVEADGSGNQAFHNFLFDLTIDVGAGNPGADGIDYLANNRGAVRNVVVRAPAGSGNTGISMERRWPGPCLLQDVRIHGFARALSLQHWNYAVTAEHVRLSGQRVVGIDNGNNVLSVRDLVSHNSVPAVRSGTPTEHDGLLTLLDSRLVGGALGVAAVENDGHALLRNVRQEGYGVPVRHRGVAMYPENSISWTSSPTLPDSNSDSDSASDRISSPLFDVVPPTPGLPDVSAEDWLGVVAHGGKPDDNEDDTAALQRALHSGSPVVYLSGGQYQISRTLDVPSTVRALVGFDTSIQAVGSSFAEGQTSAVFRVLGDSAVPITFSHLSLSAPATAVDVERRGDRPVSLEHMHMGSIPFRGTPGDLFVADVAGGAGWRVTRDQSVWARQLNAEQDHTKVLNAGGDVWILGFKTESVGTGIHSMDGARTEVLGGNLYPSAVFTKQMAAFSAVGARQSLTFVVGADDPSRAYAHLVTASSGGAASVVGPGEARRRGSAGSAVVLFVGDQPPAATNVGPTPSTNPGD